MSSPSASVSPPTPPRALHGERAPKFKPSNEEMQFVVLDFLISAGFPRTAESFAKEARMNLPVAQQSIQERVDIRRAILAGDIDSAIDKINNLSPEILDRDPTLHFAVLRLQLVELIRKHAAVSKPDIMPAINFAQQNLAARAAVNAEFRQELEKTMTLLILLPNTDDMPPQYKELLSPSLRRDVASRVNEALLLNDGQLSEARLRNLYRVNNWARWKCDESQIRVLPEPSPS